MKYDFISDAKIDFLFINSVIHGFLYVYKFNE